MDDYNDSTDNINTDSDITTPTAEDITNPEEQSTNNPINGNGYNGLASSNRQAFTRGLDQSYTDRLARSRANLDQARARSNDPHKMKRGHEDEEKKEDSNNPENNNFKEKNILDKAGDKANLLKSKASLLGNQIDNARSKALIVAKRKIRNWLIGIIGFCTPYILITLGVIIFVVIIAGDVDTDDVATDYSSISTKYSYCESVNLEGELIPLEQYVAGVILGEALTWEDEDALMAQAIASRTFVLYNTNGCEKVATNGQTYQVYRDPNNDDRYPKATREKVLKIAKDTEGLVLTYDGDLFESNFDAFCYMDGDCPDSVKNADGTYTVTYTKKPANEKHKITLSDESYYNAVESDNIKGHGHGWGMSQYVSYQMAKEGKTYEEILKYFYSDGVQISNLNSPASSKPGTENESNGTGYTSTYTNLKSGKTYKNFKQFLYKESYPNLSSAGCGTVSGAIILNSFDESFTPISLYNEFGNTSYKHFNKYYKNGKKDYEYCKSWSDGWCLSTNDNTKLKNDNMKEALISNLSNGGTAVLFISYTEDKCLVNGTSWTEKQHFFVALDYNSDNNTIYISNPGSSKSQKNGWVSLDAFKCVHVAMLLYP